MCSKSPKYLFLIFISVVAVLVTMFVSSRIDPDLMKYRTLWAMAFAFFMFIFVVSLFESIHWDTIEENFDRQFDRKLPWSKKDLPGMVAAQESVTRRLKAEAKNIAGLLASQSEMLFPEGGTTDPRRIARTLRMKKAAKMKKKIKEAEAGWRKIKRLAGKFGFAVPKDWQSCLVPPVKPKIKKRGGEI